MVGLCASGALKAPVYPVSSGRMAAAMGCQPVRTREWACFSRKALATTLQAVPPRGPRPGRRSWPGPIPPGRWHAARSRSMTWCVPAWWGGCRGHPGGGRGACEADSLKQAPKARDRCFRCYVHCDASPDITQITHQGVFLAKESQSSAISQWVMRPTY